MDWEIPMPGDWHILMNFQKALMKTYFNAGFKHLAIAAGYPPATIEACGQFKRTHQFLMEVWKALYRAMLGAYISGQAEDPLDLIAEKLIPGLQPIGCEKLSGTIDSTVFIEGFQNFKASMQNLAQRDETWRFWVFEDLLA